MRGYPRALARGISFPLHPLTKGAFVPPVEPQIGALLPPRERASATPTKGAFVLPWKPMTAVSAAASTKGLRALWKPDQGASTPGPPAGISACTDQGGTLNPFITGGWGGEWNGHSAADGPDPRPADRRGTSGHRRKGR
mgnify:CR=1 FL=1